MESADFVFDNGVSVTLKMGSAGFIFDNLEAEIDDLEGISFAFDMVQTAETEERKGKECKSSSSLSSPWKITLVVESSDTVAGVMVKVQGKEGFPLIQQSLEFDSKLQLEGSSTSPDCNIQEATLYLALPLRCGQ